MTVQLDGMEDYSHVSSLPMQLQGLIFHCHGSSDFSVANHNMDDCPAIGHQRKCYAKEKTSVNIRVFDLNTMYCWRMLPNN